jgi:LuxR family transcriptional regulator, maltose regulon positive regulatory protein
MGGREAVQVADPAASVVNLRDARGEPAAHLRDGADPVVQLASAVAALLLEAIARDELAVLIRRDVADLLGELSRPAPPPGEPAGPAEPLTESETRILRYLATHLSAREIAAELSVSANTVKTHMRHLYQKLGAHSRDEAVHRARASGLLAVSFRRP